MANYLLPAALTATVVAAAGLFFLIRAVRRINERWDKMSKEMDDLTAQVAAQTTVEQSAITLIEGLAAQLAAAGTDPAKLAALTTQLKTSADALSAAITANTPVAPAAPAPTG